MAAYSTAGVSVGVEGCRLEDEGGRVGEVARTGRRGRDGRVEGWSWSEVLISWAGNVGETQDAHVSGSYLGDILYLLRLAMTAILLFCSASASLFLGLCRRGDSLAHLNRAMNV